VVKEIKRNKILSDIRIVLILDRFYAVNDHPSIHHMMEQPAVHDDTRSNPCSLQHSRDVFDKLDICV
jgi:hypothetical protein